MTRIYADVEALKALRAALPDFARRQYEAIEQAEAEIARTQQRLEEAEQKARYEVECARAALESCYYQAMMAAQQGYSVDCSGYEYALRQAEERLVRILEWQNRVRQEAESFRAVAYAYRDRLADAISNATAYLDRRITALEAYHATRLQATAVGVAATGALGLMGGVIAAIRQNRGELARLKGAVGEEIAAQILSEKFGLTPLPFDQPKHGFDRVFTAPGIPVLVAEAKVRSGGALDLGQTQAGEQASPEWIAAHAQRMADRESAAWSPANERIARLIQEIGPENVPVVTVVIDPQSGQGQAYLRQGETDWQPLGGSTSLDSLGSAPPPGPSAPPEFKEGFGGGPERRG
ncbi:MAG: hypothetical protein H5T61_13640 [Thermoflexales bacterium]|nr:hypothetical protein [Thermoflexales bacterium]